MFKEPSNNETQGFSVYGKIRATWDTGTQTWTVVSEEYKTGATNTETFYKITEEEIREKIDAFVTDDDKIEEYVTWAAENNIPPRI